MNCEKAISVKFTALSINSTHMKMTITFLRNITPAAPIMTSLKTLSKHEEREPEGWQSWWNKNNKGNWEGGK